MGAEGDRVAKRMQRGCRCFAAEIGAEIVGYGWVSMAAEWIGETQTEIRPARGEAYIWNCVTLPAYRQKGVFRALLRAINSQLKGDGLSRVWIGSLVDPAEKAIGGAGFVPVMRLDATSRWGFRWLTVRPAYKADPQLIPAASLALRSRGVPFGSGFYLRWAEGRRH
ncbi:MAG TPA: GNAT family N-acetyltransferase [Candidatus Dormibacteraeota bacterium]|nr:GNAT family N-acetyltransferase [Candidatus Dormibacteraeota bacterium]